MQGFKLAQHGRSHLTSSSCRSSSLSVKRRPLHAQVLEALTGLDIATARGRHAALLSAVQPQFLDPSNDASGCMSVHDARHPLLLQRGLSPLPNIPGQDEEDPFATDFSNREPHRASTSGRGEEQAFEQQAWRPQPVDLLVPPGVQVAAVTGPNTGGPACDCACTTATAHGALATCLTGHSRRGTPADQG